MRGSSTAVKRHFSVPISVEKRNFVPTLSSGSRNESRIAGFHVGHDAMFELLLQPVAAYQVKHPRQAKCIVKKILPALLHLEQ